MKTSFNLLLIFVILQMSANGADSPPKWIPKDGFVPNELVAIQIAEAVLVPIYGKVKIASQKPFTAHLTNGIWTVSGSWNKEKPKLEAGGVALVELKKEDAQILRVIHGK